MKKGFIFFTLSVLFILFSLNGRSQADTSLTRGRHRTPTAYLADTADQRDVVDVLVKLFHPRNFKRAKLRPHELSFFILPGIYYSKPTGIAGTLNGTFVYLSSDDQFQNLSTLFSTASYSENKQFTVSLYSNIYTARNSFYFQGVAWYYDYSETTYGLGSKTPSSKANDLYYKYLRFHESILKQVYPDVYVGLGYRLDRHFSILEKGNKDGSVSEFDDYSGARSTTSSGPGFDFMYDDRRNQINPRRGTYVEVVYSPKYTSWGSDRNWQSLKIDLRKYLKLSPSSNNVLAFWSLSQFSFGDMPPYLDMPSTGWDDMQRSGRGYTQARYRGRDMLYLEGEYRFKITHNGVLGGVLFANASSFSEPVNDHFETVLPAAGGGIRIKLNKYTRTNLCIDYGVGAHGSSGVFVNVGEIF